MKELIVIVGPTASGKTTAAIEVAKHLDGEIINADSMQVYQFMDIGTAKPDLKERQGIVHHLMDFVHPKAPFSVAQYCILARQAIEEVQGRNRIPILVGGTGLYIDSIIENIQYTEVKGDGSYRKELENLAEQAGNEYIYQMLERIDHESAKKIMVQDRRRIIRALELYHVTGKTMSELNRLSKSVPCPYHCHVYGMLVDRETLYERINQRVDHMMDQGLVEEVKKLIELGVDRSATAMQAIGYKEIALYLSGTFTLEEATEQIKQGSRRYAKRQMTWFRRNKSIHWVKSADEILSLFRREMA